MYTLIFDAILSQGVEIGLCSVADRNRFIDALYNFEKFAKRYMSEHPERGIAVYNKLKDFDFLGYHMSFGLELNESQWLKLEHASDYFE